MVVEAAVGFARLGGMRDSRMVIFLHPARMLTAGIGILVMAGAVAGAVFYLLMLWKGDLMELAMVLGAAVAVGAIGFGLTNAWRTPLLVVELQRVLVPCFFFQREIALRPGHRIGQLLASSPHSTHRAGPIEANKFVYVFALDPDGTVVELASLHRAAPMIAEIMSALRDVAGLPIDQVERDRSARRPWPDVAEWRGRVAG
jgi:hypothetical protein